MGSDVARIERTQSQNKHFETERVILVQTNTVLLDSSTPQVH
jgi:hypothetical protein